MNEKGGAAAETLPALLTLFLFVGGILLAAYLIFARAYIQYQGEQALYCLGEAKPEYLCRQRLERKLKSTLPWGQLSEVRLNRRAQGKKDIWSAEVRWKILNYQIKTGKSLDTRRLIQSKALRW